MKKLNHFLGRFKINYKNSPRPLRNDRPLHFQFCIQLFCPSRSKFAKTKQFWYILTLTWCQPICLISILMGDFYVENVSFVFFMFELSTRTM